ncbi:DNA mismatch repair protein MutS [Terriglobus sp. 2YAB30_2]|uniref:DNA mismatch repair protein MutS n=1 Tax=unclassified Terriglobus TaxID=2628988 RepID=UPI003F9C5DDD
MTPFMRQYTAAQQAHPDCLIFFRMGDFYELFYDDAVKVSRELQLTLTARDKQKSVPMCGVPYHAAETYIQRLLRKGYRIAMCEQMEDPKTVKTIVRREVVRVLTPGTAIDPSLGSDENNFLASLAPVGKDAFGVAVLDLSTGDFRSTEFRGADAFSLALDELGRLRPVELVLPEGFHPGKAGLLSDDEVELPGLDVRTRTPVEDWVFTADYALPLLQGHFHTHSLDGFGLAGHTAAAVAAGALVHYVRSTKQGELQHLDGLKYYQRGSSLELDAVSVRNLELVEPLWTQEGVESTLFHALDTCCTPMGKRLLRSALLRPMADAACINRRLDAVDEAVGSLRLREQLRRALDNVLDLERLLARVSMDSAGPRDVLALGRTLGALPTVLAEAAAFKAEGWQVLTSGFDALTDAYATIINTIAEEPPVTLADGNFIQPGRDAELDELRTLSQSGRQSIAAIEERERERTGISSLKVRYNSVFGYYIEITKSNLGSVPADYERKQTLVNAERFTTPELKEYETKILTAHERSVEIEKRIFAELRTTVLAAAHRLKETARRVAEMDLMAGFAHLAALRNYIRPQIEPEGCIYEAVNGRHPVVERRLELAASGRFHPNSLHLDGVEGPSLLLITGPNMGGKSTYLRQAALLVIMAQMGCFVPAERMRLSLVDRVYTRIGASDNVSRGRSTFMVEMTETAAILNTATERSLVLLDEMGRGTATYDGLSLAWATVEHLHNRIGARTLFATHYHELTLLSDQLSKLENLRVACKETSTGIVFLHAVERGPANKSYGIDVARLAGLPQTVIDRARDVLRLHEKAENASVRGAIPAPPQPALQMTIFTPLSQKIVDRLQETDINSLTPMQALQLLDELKRELEGQA